MRRLSDVTLRAEDRPAPPRAGRAKPGRSVPIERVAAARPRQARLAPFQWKRARRLVFIASAVIFVCALALWLRSGSAARLAAQERLGFLDLSARAGFRVEDIFVEGRRRTEARDLLAALQVRRGDPILGIDLAAARQRLGAVPWVKTAAVERRLPGALHIIITEREPIALWQHEGRYYLVDRDGQVIGNNIDEFASLPLVVGEGAPSHVGALLDMLAGVPELAKRVKASQWVSDRRWNLEIDQSPGGIEVRLPEENAPAAWRELAQLEREQRLLERKISVVDMRLPDRLVLRIPGGLEPPPAATTRGPATKRRAAPGRDA